MDSRRRALLKGLVAGGAMQLAGCNGSGPDAVSGVAGSSEPAESNGGRTMLILGGTGFVGPYVVRRALERGFVPTLFNRGRSSLDIFPDLELLVGDRNGEIGSIRDQVLAGRRWDVVIDMSGFSAVAVRDTATLLARATDHYIFFSSVAAYRTFETVNDEDSPLHTSGRDEYGPQKAQAEREASIAMDGRVTNLRPTIIAGPEDSRDRLTYWPVRVSRGGEMLIPGPPDVPLQFVDVRDVANFAIHCARNRLFGNFNVTIPPGSYTMRQLIDDCRSVTGAVVEETWVTPAFIDAQGVDAEASLPLWDSPSGSRRSFSMIEATQAFANGLSTRAPVDTVRDTYEWWQTSAQSRRQRLRAGLEPPAEAALLRAWRSANA